MSLADEIKKIEDCKVLSSSTKDTAIREIIEHYRAGVKLGKSIVKIVPSVEGAAAERKYNPAIKDVISGNTTFMAEYNKLGPLEFILQGNGGVADCTFDMGQQIGLVDRTIQRLYAKPLPPISAADDY